MGPTLVPTFNDDDLTLVLINLGDFVWLPLNLEMPNMDSNPRSVDS